MVSQYSEDDRSMGVPTEAEASLKTDEMEATDEMDATDEKDAAGEYDGEVGCQDDATSKSL